MALPVFFVSILLIVKNSLSEEDLAAEKVPAFIPSETSTFIPLTFQDYVTAMRAERVCVPDTFTDAEFRISGIPSQGLNWMVPTVKCDSRKCNSVGQDAVDFCEYFILGVAGSNEGGEARALDFEQYIYSRYPILDPDNNGTLPDDIDSGLRFDYDFVKIFSSQGEMDNYVKSSNYGDAGFPKLAMGVVFDGNETDRYVYSLRQNSTNFNSQEQGARPGASTTPPTSVQLESFAKTDGSCPESDGEPSQGSLDGSCTGKYLYNGLIPFQRLVNDFILFDTGAAEAGYSVAEGGVRFTPFPSRAFEQSGFFSDIAGTFVSSLVGWISLTFVIMRRYHAAIGYPRISLAPSRNRRVDMQRERASSEGAHEGESATEVICF